MPRLWIKHQSDLRKGTGSGASEEASTAIYWGSARESKLCANIDVIWRKDKKQPIVQVSIGNQVFINHNELILALKKQAHWMLENK